MITRRRMLSGTGGLVAVALLMGPAMAQERILISSDWGKVTAELVDNNATRALVRMLPLTIEMRDHLRQEKTGNLPSPLPAVERQMRFSRLGSIAALIIAERIGHPVRSR